MQTIQIQEKMKKTDDLQPNQALDLIAKDNQDLVILDVTTAKEFKDRHLENAINHSFVSGSFKSVLKKFDKTKTYLVYCTVGGRSKMATNQMKKAGFQKVYNLIGGTLLWEEFEYPFAMNANRVHGFSICPFLNSMLVIKKVRHFFSQSYKWSYNKLTRALGLNRIKTKIQKYCSDLDQECRCGSLMPAAMAGRCSEIFCAKEESD